MVVAELTVSFALVVEDDCNIPKLLWQMLLVPHGLEQTCQLVVNGFTTCVEHFSRDAVRVFLLLFMQFSMANKWTETETFPLIICLIALLTSSIKGEASSSRLDGSFRWCAIALSLIVAGRLSLLLKCSISWESAFYLEQWWAVCSEQGGRSRGL